MRQEPLTSQTQGDEDVGSLVGRQQEVGAFVDGSIFGGSRGSLPRYGDEYGNEYGDEYGDEYW